MTDAAMPALPPKVETPFRRFVAAVSAGVVGGRVLLDLDYSEDSTAEVDMNLVQREDGGIIEVQGTGEHGHFDADELGRLVAAMSGGIARLHRMQRDAVGGAA